MQNAQPYSSSSLSLLETLSTVASSSRPLPVDVTSNEKTQRVYEAVETNLAQAKQELINLQNTMKLIPARVTTLKRDLTEKEGNITTLRAQLAQAEAAFKKAKQEIDPELAALETQKKSLAEAIVKADLKLDNSQTLYDLVSLGYSKSSSSNGASSSSSSTSASSSSSSTSASSKSSSSNGASSSSQSHNHSIDRGVDSLETRPNSPDLLSPDSSSPSNIESASINSAPVKITPRMALILNSYTQGDRIRYREHITKFHSYTKEDGLCIYNPDETGELMKNCDPLSMEYFPESKEKMLVQWQTQEDLYYVAQVLGKSSANLTNKPLAIRLKNVKWEESGVVIEDLRRSRFDSFIPLNNPEFLKSLVSVKVMFEGFEDLPRKEITAYKLEYHTNGVLNAQKA